MNTVVAFKPSTNERSFPQPGQLNRVATSLARPEAVAAAVSLSVLEPARLKLAKRSYVTGRIDLSDGIHLLSGDVRPKSGDLVLARITHLGHHKRIESPEGRRATMYLGDEVLLCFGDRYASDQFEAIVPERLESCHMVAAGGIAARCVNRHADTKPATRIEPIGLVADENGEPLNLAAYQLPGAGNQGATHPFTVALLGTSMNAGKTTTAAALIRGFRSKGFSVGAVKVTGTGAGGDRWALTDAGANVVLDFTDFGLPSTYKAPVSATQDILRRAHERIAAMPCDVLVVEIADGLFFPETADLVKSPAFKGVVDGVMLAASDAMGATAGVAWLNEQQLNVLGVAGRMTSSPLAVREATMAIEPPVVSLAELNSGDWLDCLMPGQHVDAK